MKITTIPELFRALVRATSHSDVRAILAAIGDYADNGLDQTFGPLNLCWHAFGNNPSNLSTIGLGTKPGRSLTERVTNAMDAILEDRAAPYVALPPSPRVAAQQWFGRPVSGPTDGLFNWSFAEYGYDR